MMKDRENMLVEIVILCIIVFIVSMALTGCGDEYQQNCNYSPKIVSLSNCHQDIEFGCELCEAHFDDETSGPRCDAELGDSKVSN